MKSVYMIETHAFSIERRQTVGMKEIAVSLLDETEVLVGNGEHTRTRISRALSYIDEAEVRIIFCWTEPIYRFAVADVVSLRHAAVQLRLSGLGTQEELSRAFGHSVATQRRWETRYQAQGLEGLENGKSSGRPPRVPKCLDSILQKWFAEGLTNREMARRLQVSDVAICRALSRLSLRRRRRVSAELPWQDDTSADRGPAHVDSTCPSQDAGDEGAKEIVAVPLVESLQEQQALSDLAGALLASEPADVAGSLAAEDFPIDSSGGRGRSVFGGESLEDALARLAIEGFTLDRDPDDRRGDRGLARIGQLEDAIPLFKDRPCLARAGVLLAIPLLSESGLLEVFSKVYHSLGAAFYGLRTTVVVLFLSALLRIKRPENFKEYSPRELGHVLGLDRVPEVKTVRRKLTAMAARRRARELMHAYAQCRIDEDPGRLAFLYIDGHVREYHGQHPLAKAKKSQSQVAKPAATDNWVHDAHGEPLLVVTSEMNEGLTQVLHPILEDVKRLIGDRRPTVIFDRGGFSPKLFASLDKLGFDVMTYRKGKISLWPISHFSTAELVVDGRTCRYEVAERHRVRVGRLRPKRKKESSQKTPQYLWMREVRILRGDGRQTSILTSRTDLSAVQAAYRQFNRWRQENFFKYMDAEYELDGLLEYRVQGVAEGSDRPNPARRPVEKALASAKAQVQRLQADLGDHVEAGGKSSQRTMRGFKIAHAELRAELAEAERKVADLKLQLDDLPKRVPASDLKTLTTEKKLIADTIKMAAYQVETKLLAMLRQYYCRTDDEGRTLLQAAFQSTARIEVKEDELFVELVAQSSPHRTQALAALCRDLNALSVKFPGSQLRLCLAVQAHEPLRNPEGECQEF